MLMNDIHLILLTITYFLNFRTFAHINQVKISFNFVNLPKVTNSISSMPSRSR